MLYISSFLSFHHLTSTFESAKTSSIFTKVVISCFFISFVMCDLVSKKKRALRKIPGPRAYPIIGNAPQLIFPPDQIFSWLMSVNQKWGDIVRFWVFGSPKVFVNSYDIAMQLLSRKTFLLKSEQFDPLRQIGGHSLAGASPEMHPCRRKVLGPGFNRVAVEDSLEIFSKHARKLRDSLIGFAENGQVFNAMDYTGLCAYKIGCEAAVGLQTVQDLWNVDFEEQIAAWHMLLVHLADRSFQPWLKYDFMFNRTPEGKQAQQCFQKINKFAENLIFLRRQNWEFRKANGFYGDDDDKMDKDKSEKKVPTPTLEVKHECFLDLLLDLEDRKELTKEQVLHDLNSYIVSGYDTTGTTLAWILHLLSTHPEIQEKCVQEIVQILFEDQTSPEPRPGSSSSMQSPQPQPPPPPPYHPSQFPSIEAYNASVFSLIFSTSHLPIITDSHLKRFIYLEWVIKEALRLYPVLPWLLRRTDEDIELEDGRVIPSGVDVPINTFVIHRNPKHFQDPDVFNPERYSNEEGGSGGLLSFGAGPRICPGMLFAMHELKVILVHLLIAYKWESRENEGGQSEKKGDGGNEKKCLFHGVLVPANGVNVQISKRLL